MEIRILRGHEVKEASNFIAKMFQHTTVSDQYQNDKLLTQIKEGHLILLGAFCDKLVGIAGLKDFQYLSFLLVEDHYQRQSIGTQLLEKIKQLVYDELTVCVYPQFKEFYLKNGFLVMEKASHENDVIEMVYQSENVKQFDNYDQVHEFIASQKKRVYALDNFRRFMNDLCNPQFLLKTIHIGGTNGKGSTTNYIRSVLQKEGYRVATFTSPVLVTRLEVMRINNQHIQEQEIIRYANRYMSLWLKYELSMFEIEVFIAIMFFLKHRVDFAIFEVGLGGELDATNIVAPIVAVNTNIGLDHVEYLGDTYEKIAYTKGGIIKDYVPFITGEKKEVCLKVFEQLCQQHHSPLICVQNIEQIHQQNGSLSYVYRGYQIELNTLAMYQIENSALAIEILLYLNDHGYIALNEEHLKEGLKEAVWEGRFETVNENPLIIIDGAHNKEGMEAFYQSAKKFPHVKVIFSALRDKDTHAMLEKLLMLTKDVTVCEFDFYRAQSAEKLAESFPVKIEKDWHRAVDEAFMHQGTVFITGSLYFIAQVRAYILNRKKG